MRRGSVIGPLILIAIGAIFLLRNFLPEFRVMEVLAVYWPWLLIGWGTLRVFEVLHWHREGRLTNRGGINGGEWVLVVFICLVGSGLYAARNANLFRINGIPLPNWDILGERFDYTVQGNLAGVGKAPRILIDNARGDARVIGIDSEEVRVTGTKSIRALTHDDANKEDKATPLEVVRSGDQIIIRTNLERASDPRQARAEIEITVPKGASVEGRGKYGDFDIENVDGTVDVTSDNAGVRLNNIGQNIRVDLRRSDMVRVLNAKASVEIKGRGQDVELENIAGPATVDGQYSGEMKFRNLAKPFRFESQNSSMRMERIDGEVELAHGRLSGRRVTGPIQIRSQSKDVELYDFTDVVEIDVDRGDIQIRPGRLPLNKMQLRTRSGRAELILPDAAKLDLKATVERGEIENTFSEALRVVEDGRRATLAGSLGGPQVTIEVDRGEIAIRKSSADGVPLPPNPPKAMAPLNSPAPAKPPRAPLEITRQ